MDVLQYPHSAQERIIAMKAVVYVFILAGMSTVHSYVAIVEDYTCMWF